MEQPNQWPTIPNKSNAGAPNNILDIIKAPRQAVPPSRQKVNESTVLKTGTNQISKLVFSTRVLDRYNPRSPR